MKKVFNGLIYSVALVSFIFLISCSSTKQLSNDSNSKNYILNDGELKESTAVAGLPFSKEVTFSSAGQSITFLDGEQVKINFDGFDWTKNTLKITYDEENQSVTIATVSLDEATIKFTKKCETIRWENTKILPSITLADNLPTEQIIITPYFDDNCYKKGYEFRYGSMENGCRKAGQKVFSRFKDCSKHKKAGKSKHEKKIKKQKEQKKPKKSGEEGNGPW